MKLKDFLLVSFLILISPVLTGYYFGILDHDHYLPYLNKLQDQSLYPRDYYFSQPHGNYAWFDQVIVWLKNLSGLDLPWFHLILYLGSLWLLYCSIYWLAKILSGKTAVAAMAITFFILPKWASQIGYMTHHFYFVTRDLSLGLSLLALNFILIKNYKFSVFFLLLAFIVNPAIPIPVLILLIIDLPQKLNWALFPLNSSWLTTMQQRGTYSFPHLWHWTGWGSLLYFGSLLSISWLTLKQNIFGHYRLIIKKFLIICSGLFLFHWLISSLFPIPQLIQFQLLRSINFIFVLALITIAITIVNLLERANLAVKFSAVLAAFSLHFWSLHLTLWHILAVWLLPIIWWFYPKKNNFRLNKTLPSIITGLILLSSFTYQLIMVKPRINLPYYWYYPNVLFNLDTFGDWHQVQLWAKTNTPVEAVFLVPPQWSGFRSFSERGIVADAKDGGVIFYSPEYAKNWQSKMSSLENYQQFSAEKFISLRSLYYFDYLIVTAKHQFLPFTLVFQNQGFSVYRL